jgi:hypothetical protein
MIAIATITGKGYASSIIYEEKEAQPRVHYIGNVDIDADGAPHAYNPSNTGLDRIANAKDTMGNWCGVLVDSSGKPLTQGAGDPAPGYYISTTAYELANMPKGTQRRYLNAETIPFIVVPPVIIHGVPGIVKGCKVRITDMVTRLICDAMVGDIGPRNKDGEVSIAAAKRLSVPSSPIIGGFSSPRFLYELWPGVPAVIDGVQYALMAS